MTSYPHVHAGVLTRPLLASLLLLVAVVVGGCNGADARPAVDADAGQERSQRTALEGVDLRPATIEVGHTMGDSAAPIAVVEFSDFGCPYCARFATTTLPTIHEELIDAGIVRWRYVPVTFGFAGGELMGAAAECAAQLGGTETFWQVHDLFYERQVALRGEDARTRILEWLPELGLDRARLDACMSAPETRQLLDRNNEASAGWFVRGTPTFVVNGVPMSGAMPMDFFRKVFGTALDPSGL